MVARSGARSRGMEEESALIDKGLHRVVEEANLPSLRRLLATRPDLEVTFNGATALSMAIAKNWWPQVELLIEAGASLHARDRWNNTPVHIAAFQSDSRFLAALLAARNNGNQRGAASDDDDGDVVAAVNDRFRTALHHACVRGLAENVRLLLAAGADRHALDREDHTPLHLAIHAGPHEPRVIEEMLIGQPALPASLVDDEGDSLLHDAVRYEDRDAVRLLLSHQAVPAGAINNARRTPLHLAARRAMSEAVAALLEHGADPNAADANGDTPLSDAMAHDTDGSHARVVSMLLDASNAACRLQTSKQLLYVPASPLVGTTTPNEAATTAVAARGPSATPRATASDTAKTGGAVDGLRGRRRTPSTRARGVLAGAFEPGAELLECTICCGEVHLRPSRRGEGDAAPDDEAEAGRSGCDQAAITACGHVYHLECWQQVVAHAGTGGIKCPNCREGCTLRRATPLSPPPALPTPSPARPAAKPRPRATPLAAPLRAYLSDAENTPPVNNGSRAVNGGLHELSPVARSARTAEACGEALVGLSRKQLQQRARAAGLRANAPSATLVTQLVSLSNGVPAADEPPEGGTPAPPPPAPPSPAAPPAAPPSTRASSASQRRPAASAPLSAGRPLTRAFGATLGRQLRPRTSQQVVTIEPLW